jgi:AAA family ATP:ADP antiporter
VAQFWAFTNDIYSEEAGKRLFPLLGLGASVGAVAGSFIAQRLIGLLGMMSLLLIAAVILLVSAGLGQWVHAREASGAESPRTQSASLPIGGARGDAFALVYRNPYLRSIALFSLLFTCVKTNGDYLLARLVKAAASSTAGGISADQFIGSFYADYFFYVDIVSLVLQAFVVSRLVKYVGTRLSFYIMPALALLDATTITLLPLLRIVRVGKVLESATDYSLNNTVRNLLWLPTTRREKYLAKQAVDTFFVRLGDVASAALVFLGAHWLGWGVVPFAGCNVVMSCCWLVLAGIIMRQRARLNSEQLG